MKLTAYLITFAAAGVCTLLFLRKKPALAEAILPKQLLPKPVGKNSAGGRRKAPRKAKPHPAHHKRNGMKTHSAN